jgi:hypothetical protein
MHLMQHNSEILGSAIRSCTVIVAATICGQPRTGIGAVKFLPGKAVKHFLRAIAWIHGEDDTVAKPDWQIVEVAELKAGVENLVTMHGKNSGRGDKRRASLSEPKARKSA